MKLKEYMKEVMVGTKGSYGQYAKINFSDEFVDMEKLASTGWTYDSKEGNVRVSKPTQDKIDITIQTPEGLKNLSVKNYNFKGGTAQISLVSGMSLLTILQNENNKDFVNHYLNITSSREASEDDNLAHMKEYRASMHDMVKEIILVKALTGLNIQKTMKDGTVNSNTSIEYFVVNDNSRPGQFKIYSVSDFLDFSSFDNKSGLSKYATINGYNNPIWKNQGENARARITRLMTQMHQTKLHAFASSKMLM